jgi:hypothetical protein
MSSVFGVGFYLYRSSFDASAFSTTVSSLLSALLVVLLVWERLRDSLFKKLEYLDENIYLGLYSQLEKGDLLWKQEGIEKAKNDLRKYAKFLVIALYPKKLPKELSAFLQLHSSFYAKEEQLLNIAKQMLKGIPSKGVSEPYRVTLLGILFEIYYYPPSSEEERAIYAELAGSMKQGYSDLINEAKTIFEKATKEQKRILEKLEEFLKQNNLRVKPEPTKVISGY